MKKTPYGKLPTEQPNPRTRKIDRISIPQLINVIHREDDQVPKSVGRCKKEIAQAVCLIVSKLRLGGRLFFVGAGTSGRLGVLEAAECPPTFNTPPHLVQAVMAGGNGAVFQSKEGAEDRLRDGYSRISRKILKQDVVVGIAASGITPFVRGALQAAKEKQAATILICCNKKSPLKGIARCVIAPETGPEVITGSTRLKAGTATKLILNTLTVASMIQIGKVYQNWMVDLQPKSKKLKARGLRLISQLGRVSDSEAERCFQKAKHNVKLAILMAKTGWDRKTSQKKLAKVSGFLGKALK